MTQITAEDFGLLEHEPEGWSPGIRVEGHDFMMPEFEMVENPTIRISDIRRRRFNIIDRAQVAAREEIQAEEDEEIFAALRYATEHSMPAMARRLAQGARDAAQGARNMTDALRRYVERWSSHMRRGERSDIIGR